MPYPLYKVLTLDLATVRTRLAIPEFPTGIQFDAISVLDLPVGAAASVAFHPSGDLIPLVTGRTIRFLDECERPFMATDGLFVSNPAGAGALVLLVSQGVSH